MTPINPMRGRWCRACTAFILWFSVRGSRFQVQGDPLTRDSKFMVQSSRRLPEADSKFRVQGDPLTRDSKFMVQSSRFEDDEDQLNLDPL